MVSVSTSFPLCIIISGRLKCESKAHVKIVSAMPNMFIGKVLPKKQNSFIFSFTQPTTAHAFHTLLSPSEVAIASALLVEAVHILVL